MAKRFKGETGDIYFRKVPAWLRDMFHASCTMRGSNMKKEFIKFMKDFVGCNRPPVNLRTITTKRRWNNRKKSLKRKAKPI